MSDETPTAPTFTAPANHTHYAFVVDGDLGWLHSIDNNLEGANAVFKSSPTIVEISEEQFLNFLNGPIPPYGNYKWDGANWTIAEE